ncbi:ATP-dependent endonuclease [Cryobacterium sp. PAMC25264]|uniref:ATP-dependent nuclease n=1 Tax=Cryobacterium sp. PAMC25264 TaxID=2861288 RepID=UPI001C633553|nr:AAA family ATPase [Cryobacterium sp. PAMC25264]QYF74392.1 AAA family ATPase [Cryobacterium sp. PAMC25264]
MDATSVIRSITISDGTTVALPEQGVVLLVGPNNAGKSQALRDIARQATSKSRDGVVVTASDVSYVGSKSDLLETFEKDKAIIRAPGSDDRVSVGKSEMPLSQLLALWSGSNQHHVGGYFLQHADTESRLNASRPVGALNLYEKNPSHPLHRLYMRQDLEVRLNGICREAFDKGLILDTWAGGSSWALRVGELAPPNSSRPDQKYLEELRELPLLHTQGDGMRSMMGLLLNLMTGHQSISLVDEPEAFLHPPQARFLGKLLSEDTSESLRTIFLSTHSSDVVHGVLEGSANTTVVRLRRQGNTNEAAVLDNDAVRKLWSDPLLRYSNLLEGLFTDAVVVCESDADCKFFASIRDTLSATEVDTRRADILFTSCGGKSRMHVAVESLRAASVPVAVVGDFDVLNDWPTLSRLVKSAGGNPLDFEPDWRILSGALTAKARTPSVIGMKEAVAKAFEAVTEVTTKSLAPVREALKIENGWDRVKNTGLTGVPKGDAYLAASRLLDGLGAIHIHLLPVGEMEDLVPMVSGHGPAWLAEVLERRLHEGPDGDSARGFFNEVIQSIAPGAE